MNSYHVLSLQHFVDAGPNDKKFDEGDKKMLCLALEGFERTACVVFGNTWLGCCKSIVQRIRTGDLKDKHTPTLRYKLDCNLCATASFIKNRWATELAFQFGIDTLLEPSSLVSLFISMMAKVMVRHDDVEIFRDSISGIIVRDNIRPVIVPPTAPAAATARVIQPKNNTPNPPRAIRQPREKLPRICVHHIIKLLAASTGAPSYPAGLAVCKGTDVLCKEGKHFPHSLVKMSIYQLKSSLAEAWGNPPNITTAFKDELVAACNKAKGL